MSPLTVATYNLWGINEPWRYTVERNIVRGAVPSSPATTLRLAGGAWSRRRQLLMHELEQVRPDVVGLQEVPGARDTSQAAPLADELGFPYVVSPDAQQNEGLAVFARYPIIASRTIPLEKTGVVTAPVHTVITGPWGDLNLIVCHLTTHSEEAQVVAVEQLLAYLDQLPADCASILVGDFNAESASPTIQLITSARPRRLHDAWREANPGDLGATMPSHEPISRLDYIFVSDELEVLKAARIGMQPDADGFYPSDHLGVLVTLRYREGNDHKGEAACLT